ncbi:hypothetical protein HOY80DRAFT_1047444 [Tuber brumale]|nr:hypothetical protein HOY80DRAFT_1047444 [Tuber brumale]
MSGAIFKEIHDAITTRSPDRLIFHDLDPEDFHHVIQSLRHPTNNLERRSFRIHWFAAEKILKVVMPSHLHECSGAWLFEMIMSGLAKRIIPRAWVETMTISPAPEYLNFMGQYTGSMKEADLTFVPLVSPNWTTDAEFPSVVLESGWSEGAEQLNRDATLWQQGSGGQVRVVIQVKFFPRSENRIGARLWINRANPYGNSSEICPPGNDVGGSPAITFHEFFAGDCPPGIDPEGYVVLDLDRLRVKARRAILARNCLPDDDY